MGREKWGWNKVRESVDFTSESFLRFTTFSPSTGNAPSPAGFRLERPRESRSASLAASSASLASWLSSFTYTIRHFASVHPSPRSGNRSSLAPAPADRLASQRTSARRSSHALCYEGSDQQQGSSVAYLGHDSTLTVDGPRHRLPYPSGTGKGDSAFINFCQPSTLINCTSKKNPFCWSTQRNLGERTPQSRTLLLAIPTATSTCCHKTQMFDLKAAGEVSTAARSRTNTVSGSVSSVAFTFCAQGC